MSTAEEEGATAEGHTEEKGKHTRGDGDGDDGGGDATETEEEEMATTEEEKMATAEEMVTETAEEMANSGCRMPFLRRRGAVQKSGYVVPFAELGILGMILISRSCDVVWSRVMVMIDRLPRDVASLL
ncbi:hypothetical protein Dimus_001677 [Dionaea muscipula]